MTAINQILVIYLVNALWQIPTIAVIGLLSALLLGRFPSVYLHRLWVAALLASVLVPFMSLRAPILTPDAVDGISSKQSVVRSHLPPPIAAPSMSAFSWSILGRRYQITLAPRLLAILTAVYFCLLFYRVFRLLGGYYQTTRLLRGSTLTRVSSAVLEILPNTLVRDALVSLSIRSSDLAAAPFTAGLRPPILVLPARFSEVTLPLDQASAICHELAHIRRHDFLLNLIYEIVSLPASFHPVTLWIKNRISCTREFICDESAAAVFSAPRAYAKSLLNIAQYLTVAVDPAPQSHALGLFNAAILEERIINLLKGQNHMGKIGKYSLLFVTAAFLCAATLSVSAYSFQVAHSPMQAFAGTWKAVHEGKTIIVLRLHLDEEPPSGSIRLAGFQLDLEGNGAILTVTDERLDSPIAL